jgi:hypothetical protein
MFEAENPVLRKAAVVFSAILLGVAALVLSFGLVRSPTHASGFSAIVQSRTAKYSAYGSSVYAKEVPWIFDGRHREKGKVLAVWDADTAENRTACKNEWNRSSAYYTLCTDISNQKILVVELSGLEIPLVAYVPVSRIAKVDLGEIALIRMGNISGDSVVHALPSLIRTLPGKPASTRP